MISDKHVIVDGRCKECFWPMLKKCECGGTIHNEFVDEMWDGENDHVITSKHCDKCDNPREV